MRLSYRNISAPGYWPYNRGGGAREPSSEFTVCRYLDSYVKKHRGEPFSNAQNYRPNHIPILTIRYFIYLPPIYRYNLQRTNFWRLPLRNLLYFIRVHPRTPVQTPAPSGQTSPTKGCMWCWAELVITSYVPSPLPRPLSAFPQITLSSKILCP
jgi:hypothetical protein